MFPAQTEREILRWDARFGPGDEPPYGRYLSRPGANGARIHGSTLHPATAGRGREHVDPHDGPRLAAQSGGAWYGVMTPRKLVRLVEIAELLVVSKQRADQLRGRADFPAPVDRYSRGDLWAASDVRRWARTWVGGAARWGQRPREAMIEELRRRGA